MGQRLADYTWPYADQDPVALSEITKRVARVGGIEDLITYANQCGLRRPSRARIFTFSRITLQRAEKTQRLGRDAVLEDATSLAAQWKTLAGQTHQSARPAPAAPHGNKRSAPGRRGRRDC